MIGARADRLVFGDVAEESILSQGLRIIGIECRQRARRVADRSWHLRRIEVSRQRLQSSAECTFGIQTNLHWQEQSTCSEIARFEDPAAIQFTLNAESPVQRLGFFLVGDA